MRSSPNLTEARQTIEDAIAAYASGARYCAYSRDLAVQALVCDAPCILNTGGYGNQGAALAADAANRGEDFIDFIEATFSRRGSNFVRDLILGELVGVNASGAALLETARAHFAPLALAAE